MRPRILCHHLQKHGNVADDYEDAFYWTRPRRTDVGEFRIAVSDGATESSFSALWAQMLTRAYVHRGLLGPADGWPAKLASYQARWLRHVTSRPLPWYAEEKVQLGAFASVTGLTIRDRTSRVSERRWEAMAVGDSCAFRIRRETVLEAFPLAASQEFNNRPVLVSSLAPRNARLGEHCFRTTSTWEPGDAFLLMTDALAAWFLRSLEENADPWAFVRAVHGSGGDEAFRTWVERLRATGELRNDDVTLVRVDLDVADGQGVAIAGSGNERAQT